MPNYFYTAKSFDGTTKSGGTYAEDEAALARQLKTENLILIKAVT